MKLITKEIETAFEKQGYTGEKTADEIKVICKLFGGAGASWYLYEKEDDDIYMAFVDLGNADFAECGRVSLKELKALRFPPFGLHIERDMHFGNHTLEEVIKTVKSGGCI